jgi:hypothetical protein
VNSGIWVVVKLYATILLPNESKPPLTWGTDLFIICGNSPDVQPLNPTYLLSSVLNIVWFCVVCLFLTKCLLFHFLVGCVVYGQCAFLMVWILALWQKSFQKWQHCV